MRAAHTLTTDGEEPGSALRAGLWAPPFPGKSQALHTQEDLNGGAGHQSIGPPSGAFAKTGVAREGVLARQRNTARE